MKVREKIFEKKFSTVGVKLQNLGSREIWLTDVSHYLNYEPSKVLGTLDKDGKKLEEFTAQK